MGEKRHSLLFLMLACICLLAVVAAPALAWWGDSGEQNPGTNMLGGTSCSRSYWYQWDHFTSCAARNFYATWNHGFVWSGRGWYHEDIWRPGYYSGSAAWPLARAINQGGGDNGNNWRTYSACNQGCDWITVYDQAVDDVYNYNGIRIDANESQDSCKSCGNAVTMVGQVHGYGERWSYLNRWVTLGPFPSTSLGDAHGIDEANLYMYPYVDVGGGGTICAGLFGGVWRPVAYAPGDMNNAYSVNFATLYNYSAPNQDAYAFAWIYSPGGAGPKFDIGSDDGERCWVNGALITDVNVDRGLTRDSDVTGGVGLPAGWSRVLLKVHQGPGGGGWQGTVSLRAGDDNRQNEGSVSYQSDRYGGYSVYDEQDAWYPTLTLANADGVTNPGLGAAIYTNDTTVTASGTAAGNFIPLWQVMQSQWGYGIAMSSNYLPTTVNTANWSHSEAGVTGHRRFHFFGVSRSGRTSGQASGSSGGWTWDNSGHANYFDMYVDNVVPVDPSLSSVTVAGPNQVDVAWAIPLDQGCGGVPDGSTEVATAVFDGANYYLRGDVGVHVRRNGGSIYGWGTGSSVSDTGLDSNTTYTYDIGARDNTGESRGAWHNTTGYVGAISVCTLAEAPSSANVTAPAPGTFTTAAWPGLTSSSFGAGNHLVSAFKYKWSASASDSIAEAEGTDWSSGTLSALPGSEGTYYLYMRSYNAAGVGNGSTQFGPYTISNPVPTISIGAPSASLTKGGPVTYEITYGDAAAITLADGDVTLNTTGTADGTVAVSGTGLTTRTVTISSVTGDGTLGISIAAGTASNGSSTAPAAGPSDTFTVDNTPPTVSIGAPSASLTEGGPVTYEITYGGADAVTLADANVTLNKTATADAGSVVVSGTGLTTRTVTISGITGSGTLGISIAAGTASDLAGNTALAADPSATFDVVNHVASYGVNNKAVQDAIMGAASANFKFTVWGKVTKIDDNSFTVDDGASMPVKVVFTGHGLSDGDYASATGTLNVGVAPPVLSAQLVKKRN